MGIIMDEAKEFAQWCLIACVLVIGVYGGLLLNDAYPPFGLVCAWVTVVVAAEYTLRWFVNAVRDSRRSGIDDMEDSEPFVDEWDEDSSTLHGEDEAPPPTF
jgi:hypothetical protein